MNSLLSIYNADCNCLLSIDIFISFSIRFTPSTFCGIFGISKSFLTYLLFIYN